MAADIVINNQKKAVIIETLKAKKYKPFPKNGPTNKTEEEGEGEESEQQDAGANGGYDYLLSMPLWSLTLEKVQQLEVWARVCGVGVHVLL